VAWLVGTTEPGSRVKVKLLSIGWAEICRDLERATEFDQSHMFRKIYEEEFGSPGGEPYGLIMIDHEVRHRPMPGFPTDDVTALSNLASVAAAAFSPIVISAAPEFLQLDQFSDLATVTDVTAPLRGADYTRWRSIAQREDTRFLALTLPRLLARPPWADDPRRTDGFRYAEYAPDAESRVWMTAGFGFAAAAGRAFANHAWPADVRGVEMDRVGGGLVQNLPSETFNTDHNAIVLRPSIETVLTDRQERALIDAGLMPLSSIPYCAEMVFGAVRTLQTPGQYTGANAAAARANSKLSAQINYMLCASRFAHYLKMLGREMVGAFRTADEIEGELQKWVSRYVNASTSAGPESRARHPLVGAQVSVYERVGKPGVFGCTILLQPHFQLDDVSAAFRLVTEIGHAASR
jgi:type VI secretion system protein ImpD/type VI secretion system protein ImpC